jgi:hypothetical protein
MPSSAWLITICLFFLRHRSVEPYRLSAMTDALLGMVSIDLLLLPALLKVGVEQTIC